MVACAKNQFLGFIFNNYSLFVNLLLPDLVRGHGVYTCTIKKNKVHCYAGADKLLNDCQKYYSNYKDRESRCLETVLLARIILLTECYSRYVSHTTKSCILKILNLKKNRDFKFLAEVVEKPFTATGFIFKSLKLIC